MNELDFHSSDFIFCSDVHWSWVKEIRDKDLFVPACFMKSKKKENNYMWKRKNNTLA